MDKYIKLENALRTLCAECYWNGRCREACRDYKRLAEIPREEVEPIIMPRGKSRTKKT